MTFRVRFRRQGFFGYAKPGLRLDLQRYLNLAQRTNFASGIRDKISKVFLEGDWKNPCADRWGKITGLPVKAWR
jgi:hypothetical protein